MPGKYQNIWLTAIFLFCGFIIQNQAFASNPNGGTGSEGSWKEEWTSDFKDCFNRLGSHIKAEVPSDAGDYCDSSDAEKVYLSVFIALAKYESNYDEKAEGQNGGRKPQGLFQMDEQDMSSHKCEGTNPKDAKDNICCAVKIADDSSLGGREVEGSHKLCDSNHGIMDSFWQPMRDGTGGDGKGGSVNNTAVHEKLKQTAKEVCQSGASGASDSGGVGSPSAYSPGTFLQNLKKGVRRVR